jgi:hypothetical protein
MGTVHELPTQTWQERGLMSHCAQGGLSQMQLSMGEQLSVMHVMEHVLTQDADAESSGRHTVHEGPE